MTAEWEGRGGAVPADGRRRHPLRRAIQGNAPPIAAREDRARPLPTATGDAVAGRVALRAGPADRRSAATRFELWQKSLLIDVRCPGGQVGEFASARRSGWTTRGSSRCPIWWRLAAPARRWWWPGRPRSRSSSTALVDHCRSNASALWAANMVGQGRRRLQRRLALSARRPTAAATIAIERLFLTVSPRFEEVLPNVPNPKSPWMHVAGERLWHRPRGLGPPAATTICGNRSPATA